MVIGRFPAARPFWSRSATPGWNETRPMPPRFLLCAMSARRRSWNRIASICGAAGAVEMSALLAMRSATRWQPGTVCGVAGRSESGRESRRWIEHVQAGLRTLSATVNNVLHLHNTPDPSSRPATWASCSTGRTILAAAGQAGAVEMQIVNGLTGVVIPADRHRLEQVLLNLALNAFRFMPGGGWLSIRAARAAAAITVKQASRSGAGYRAGDCAGRSAPHF